MWQSLYYTQDGKLKTDLNQIDMAFAMQDQTGLLWVDLEAVPKAETEPLLRKTFDFHPLAIDDALNESHVPKLDDWGHYLYIVLHTVVFDEREQDVDTLELDIFVGKNYMVTHHDHPIEAVNRVWAAIQRDDRFLKNGADHLLYRLMDEIITSFMPVVEQLDLSLDQIEDEIFGKYASGTLEKLFSIKRSVLYLRRILAPQREVLNKLARDKIEAIDESDRIYFRDVYDHLVRMYDITESVRDLVSGALDSYLSVVNNRLNDVMKTLTIITTLFMPISFIASFFGMNFFQPAIPLGVWTGWPAFLITMLIITLTPIGMFLWMRHRHWM
jgi:magnesium transporter